MPQAAPDAPVPTLCRYLVKPGHESQFEEILTGHWRMLHDAGLSTDEPARLYRARDQAGNVAFIEFFSWKDTGSIQTAHETPAVMKLWEPMGALCSDMEFWNVAAIDA